MNNCRPSPIGVTVMSCPKCDYTGNKNGYYYADHDCVDIQNKIAIEELQEQVRILTERLDKCQEE